MFTTPHHLYLSSSKFLHSPAHSHIVFPRPFVILFSAMTRSFEWPFSFRFCDNNPICKSHLSLRAASHAHLMFLQAYRTFVSLYSTKCLLCSSAKLFHISWKWSITAVKQRAGQAGDLVRFWLGCAQYPIHVYRGFVSQRTQRPRCEIGHSPTSSDKVANEWRCTSTPPYVFTSWILTQSLVVTLFTTSLNTKKFYVLLTQYIYVFVRISEQTAIISLYNIN